MSQSVDLRVKQPKSFFAPLALFYLVTMLGLLLGAWQQSFAETSAGTSEGTSNVSLAQAESNPINVYSAPPDREGTVRNPESVERNYKSPSLTIPGIQSAILTVSKEIKTTAPIANLSARPGTAKKAKTATKPVDKAVARPAAPSNTQASNVSKIKEGYYLEMPAPKTQSVSTEPKRDLSGIQAVEEKALVEPATSVPVSPVSSQWLESNAQQPSPQSEFQLPSLDPESLPLDLSATSGLSSAATDALVRVTLGLLAVLGLLLAFSRAVLPRLMARYPAFFENLKRQGANSQKEATVSDATVATSFVAPNVADADLPALASMTPALPSDTQHALSSDSKKAYKPNFSTQYRSLLQALRRKKKQSVPPVTEDAPPFNLLYTSPLGKDKELHLVEIRGRQMVIASTPYSITLIRDLSESPKSQSVSDGVASQKQASVADLDSGLASQFQDETQDSEAISGTIEEEWSPQILLGLELEEATASETPSVIAEAPDENPELGLDSEASVAEAVSDAPDFISPKSNAYATRPQRLVPLSEADRLYQRYLEIVTSNKTELVTELDAEDGVLPAPSLQTVVILNEYDDAYGY